MVNVHNHRLGGDPGERAGRRPPEDHRDDLAPPYYRYIVY